VKRFSVFLVILVCLLTLGLAFVSCDDGSTGGTSSGLNGTWVYGSLEYRFNNGNFEFYQSGKPAVKGTYVTSDNIMTMTPTHYYGGWWFAGESRWYSKDQIKALGTVSDDYVDSYFIAETKTYSLSGDSLKWMDESFTWTRKK